MWLPNSKTQAMCHPVFPCFDAMAMQEMEDRLLAQPAAPDVVADARRYQALKPFFRIEDVGDEDFVFGLVVDSEALEEAAQRAKCWRGAVGATVDAAVDALAAIDAELPAEGQKP